MSRTRVFTLCLIVAMVSLLTASAAVSESYDPNRRTHPVAAASGVLLDPPTRGGPLHLDNGSFEFNGGVGTTFFDSWSVVSLPGGTTGQPGSGDWYVQTGTASPLNGFLVGRPTDGTFAAMTDQTGPGSHVLYQFFDVPTNGGLLRCDVYVQNAAGTFHDSGSLDFEAGLNQHARVDLMSPQSALDDVGSGVLLNLFYTGPGDPATQSYQTITADLGPFAGQPLRLRFAEVDNQGFFNMGVDNCSIVPPQHTIETVDLCADSSHLRFEVEIAGAVGDVVFRIGADNPVFQTPTERVSANFDSAGMITSGPEVETFGSPGLDRWQDGPISDFTVTSQGVDRWRVAGSVLHGANGFQAGDSVNQVLVRVFGSATNDVSTSAVPIDACSVPPPVADFGFSPQRPRVGEVVRFTDLSNGQVSSWSWTFGDGTGSQLRNPTHSYEQEGRYRVGLTVTGPSGSATRIREVNVLATTVAPPVVVPTPGETLVRPPGVSPRTPQVVRNRSGGKAVIWQEERPGFTVICIQLFNASGEPITDVIRVDRTQGISSHPTAAFDPKGNLGVFWRNEQSVGATGTDGSHASVRASGAAVFGGFFGPTGVTQITEIPVSSGSSAASNDPEMSIDRNGRTVVTWEDDGEIKGRVLGADYEPLGGPFSVNASGGTKPVVGSFASGDIVSVWRQTSGPSTGILARQFDDRGNAKGAPIVVTPALNAREPDVTVDDDGNFVVVWEANGSKGRDVFARTYGPGGKPDGGAFKVNDFVDGDQTRPSVDMNSSGDFFVAWESSQVTGRSTRGASGPAIFGGFFTPQGQVGSDDTLLAETDTGAAPKKPEVSVDDDDNATVVFEREDPDGSSAGIFSKEIDINESPEPCLPNDTTMCLNDNRFKVTLRWEVDAARNGSGIKVKLTEDTGYFWFFRPDNVEVVLKVLDNCAGNTNRFWVFAAGLTDVEASLRVEDTQTGVSITYFSPSVAFQPILDIGAFDTCDSGATARDPGAFERAQRRLEAEALDEILAILADRGPLEPASVAVGVERQGACVPSATTLCLNRSRFRVDVSWETANDVGAGTAVPLTSDAGYYWFFRDTNVELIVKVLDACRNFDRYWVFAAGLTNVEVNMTVTDTQTGDLKMYRSPRRTDFQTIRDVNAFGTCP